MLCGEDPAVKVIRSQKSQLTWKSFLKKNFNFENRLLNSSQHWSQITVKLEAKLCSGKNNKAFGQINRCLVLAKQSSVEFFLFPSAIYNKIRYRNRWYTFQWKTTLREFQVILSPNTLSKHKLHYEMNQSTNQLWVALSR